MAGSACGVTFLRRTSAGKKRKSGQRRHPANQIEAGDSKTDRFDTWTDEFHTENGGFVLQMVWICALFGVAFDVAVATVVLLVPVQALQLNL